MAAPGQTSLAIRAARRPVSISTKIRRGGITLSDGAGSGLVIGQDGTVTLNTEDPALSQINVQIPEIVRSQTTQLAQDIQNTVLVTVSVSALLAVLAATWLFWQITRPLARLREAAEQVAGGNLEARVNVRSKDEVGRVGLAFNHMAGQLQRQEGFAQADGGGYRP